MDRQEDDSVELVVTQNVELEDGSQLDSGSGIILSPQGVK